MAHFARINSSNIVESIFTFDNHKTLDGDGNESEAAGLNTLNKLLIEL